MYGIWALVHIQLMAKNNNKLPYGCKLNIIRGSCSPSRESAHGVWELVEARANVNGGVLEVEHIEAKHDQCAAWRLSKHGGHRGEGSQAGKGGGGVDTQLATSQISGKLLAL